MHPAVPIIIAMFSAGIGYANPLLHLPAAILGFPLALGFIAFSAASPRKALKRGWIAGSLAGIACMYWIAYPVGVYGGLSWALAIPCPILVGMIVGTYYGIYTYILNHAARALPPFALCIFSGLLWTSMETAQGVLLTGYPWMTLSSAMAFRPEWIQSAAFIGAYGLSGLLVSVATAILVWKISNPAKIWTISVVALIIILGGVRTSPQQFTDLEKTGNTSIGIIQGNIDQARKWDAKYKKTTFEKYLNLSRQVTHKTDLVVWPETAMPFYLQDGGIMRAELVNFASETNTPVLTGAPGYVLHSKGNFSLYNRAYLISPDKKYMDWYDKSHLVPFGEYIPLKDILPLGKLVQGAGDFLPGSDASPLRTGDLAMGMLICYEGIFPELAQERVEKGANILINISNDAWYGNTSAPRQHLNLVTMRTVEQGRYMIRGTNTGISACIDPLGRVSHATGLFVDAAVAAKAELLSGETFYHANYKAVTRTPLVLTLLFAIWIIISRRKNPAGIKI
ncbi:apolipoprotein N-acyltransferase [Desulfovibrio sp. JC010]|uniref:apolipoprotein N-acyltransferase n=1 Tax=Desulfovibrio sp. JC010 TaxID=2593641 RepID=UPI0013CFA890|nr:apolipoprotein N-acyltransferase [Desulfovibrio sp. JC010]NDV27390.1 apolipoprotein N-acyltransferase [Desulfovibrio sp. JC010]